MILKLKNTNFKYNKISNCQYKRPISIENIDFNEIVVPNKISFDKKDFKFFIGYKDAKKTRPLCRFLPKMSAYREDLEKPKYVFFDKR